MPLDSFEIKVDNPHASYFAGDVISGHVIVVLTDKSKLIHGIKLKLQGKAKTHWKETSGRSTSHFSDEEIFIDEKVYLLGYETDTSEMSLEEGNYSYPFSFSLPGSLPSSFCHKYGQIKYYLEATISRSKKSNYVSKLAFTINGILDLNKEPYVNSPGEMGSEKIVCCFCCASGPLGFDFKVEKQGFVPGEKIGFQVNMYNYSSRVVNCTALALIQELKFVADLDRTKNKTVEICKMEGPKVPCGDKNDWIVGANDSLLKIPPLPPSRLDGCKIINISYHLKFKMEAKDASTLKDTLGITIGTIPLMNDFSQICCSNDVDIIPSPNNKLNIMQDIYPDFPPPTYEEAMNGIKAEDAESSNSIPPDYGSIDWKSFIPKYVLYKFIN